MATLGGVFMELQQLKYFKAVASSGKIADAAQSLFISAPALSTSISRLEKELGTKLFDRTGNRITLNAQGQVFLKYTNQVFSVLQNAKKELQQNMLQQSPHISVVSVNSAMWVNLYAAFTSEFPNHILSCSTISHSQLEDAGLSVHHNFLLAYESEIPPAYAAELDSIFLFKAYPTVIVHKDHPLAQKEILDVSMLAGEKLLMSMPGGSLHTRILQLFELSGLPFPSENHYSYLARQKMVSENTGVSFLSYYPGYTPLPNIRCIPLSDPYEPWSARLYWRKDRPLAEHEVAFRDYVERFYKDLH